MTPEEEKEFKMLRMILLHTEEARDKAMKKWQNEVEVNEQAGAQIIFLEKAYEKALEQLWYRDEYFRLYESSPIKFLTKIIMKLKKLKGKIRAICPMKSKEASAEKK